MSISFANTGVGRQITKQNKFLELCNSWKRSVQLISVWSCIYPCMYSTPFTRYGASAWRKGRKEQCYSAMISGMPLKNSWSRKSNTFSQSKKPASVLQYDQPCILRTVYKETWNDYFQQQQKAKLMINGWMHIHIFYFKQFSVKPYFLKVSFQFCWKAVGKAEMNGIYCNLKFRENKEVKTR